MYDWLNRTEVEEYKDLRDSIIDLVYAGVIGIYKLPVKLFEWTYYKLRTGIDKFFGSVTFENPDWEVKYKLASNIYLFSGAKTYKNIWDLQRAIVDSKGMKRPFHEFYNDAMKIFDTYNVNWLKTEFETAYASAKMAAEWQNIYRNREDFPLLRYVTAGDERVRPSHAALDGIVRPVTDSFWRTFYPPNGFNCRCTVEQLPADAAPITQLTKQRIEELTEDVDELFRMNPGIHKYVFNARHPYFNANTLPVPLRKHFKVQRSKKFGFNIPLF